MINKMIVKKILTDLEMKQLQGQNYNKYSCLITKDTDVYKENGELLLKFRKKCIPLQLCQLGYKQYITLGKQKTSNRGNAGGRTGTRKNRIFNPKSKNIWEKTETNVYSGIMGYMDSLNWRNLCRETAFTKNHFEQYKEGLPFIQHINNLYKKLAVDKYNIQLQQALLTPNLSINNTCFSTITVNYNFRTSIHKDSGDFKDGIGNLTVLENGDYQGGYTLFPQYNIAVDVRQGDFLLMDVHEWHCNTPIILKTKDSVRLSFVAYLRKNMYKCPLVEKLIKNQMDKTTHQKILDMVGKNHQRNELGIGKYGHHWYEYIGNNYHITYYNKKYTIKKKDKKWDSFTKAYYHYLQNQ